MVQLTEVTQDTRAFLATGVSLYRKLFSPIKNIFLDDFIISLTIGYIQIKSDCRRYGTPVLAIKD
jgi:hypothetical protein